MRLSNIAHSFYSSINIQYATLRKYLKQGSLPDFIVIGAQKCGTTSLYKYLKQHPQVLPSNLKEIQYFTLNYHRGIDWYKGCFPSENQKKRRSEKIHKTVITGESSPFYIFHPLTPKRIADIVPKIKLIVLLRNPVDRAISHYHHMARIGRETLPLYDAIMSEEKRLESVYQKVESGNFESLYTLAAFSYLARGRYIEQLERYALHFEKSQILILNSQNFFSNTQIAYNKVLDFLGLDVFSLNEIKVKNAGSYKKMMI